MILKVFSKAASKAISLLQEFASKFLRKELPRQSYRIDDQLQL